MVRLEGDVAEFRFFRPGAKSVHLTGDFNDWRGNELPMALAADGWWHAKLRLPAGVFRFRYCADGEWFVDYAAFGVEPGQFGLDSVLLVPQRTLKIVPQTPAETQTHIAAA